MYHETICNELNHFNFIHAVVIYHMFIHHLICNYTKQVQVPCTKKNYFSFWVKPSSHLCDTLSSVTKIIKKSQLCFSWLAKAGVRYTQECQFVLPDIFQISSVGFYFQKNTRWWCLACCQITICCCELDLVTIWLLSIIHFI